MTSPTENQIHEFLAHLTVERNLSPRTVESYARDLRQFSAWLDEQALGLKSIERTHLRNYLGSRRDAGLSARSSARALSALRSFFRFLLQTEVLTADPTANLKSPSLWRTVPHALTTDEIDALLAAPDTSTILGIRDRAMVETLYATGLRVSELVGLTLDRVRLDPGFVRVLGKGRKERLVPLGDGAVSRLEKYFDSSRPELNRNHRPEVFLNHRGGLAAIPTPWGVPVKMTVPGSSVELPLKNEMISGISKRITIISPTISLFPSPCRKITGPAP